MIPTFIRAYEASAEIAGHRIVTFDTPASATTIASATGGAVPLVGVSDKMGASVGGMCDVHRAGLVSVQLGGTVGAGDPLTSNAAGLAIKAVPGSGANVNIIGFADQPGVSGDIIDAFMAPGVIRG